MGWPARATPCHTLPMLPAVLLAALLLAAIPASPATPQTGPEQTARQAEVARTAGRAVDAINLYREGVRLRPAWSEGWWWLGSLFYDQDRFSEAEAAFQRFASIAPKPAPAYAFLGLCEYEMRDYDRALRHFRLWAGKGWTGSTELIDVAVFHFGLLLTRDGRFVEALYLLATEAQRRGESPALAEAMGLASLRMKNLPEDYPPERREMVWLAGEAALHASLPPNDYERANEYARRLLLHYEQEANVHYFAGTLFRSEGKKVEAAQEFQRELQISPNHVPALVELARMNLDENQLGEALSFAKRAAELEPKNPEGHHILGRVLLATGQFQDSARELETAKQLVPDSATVRSHLAMAYSRLGRKKEADAELAAFMLLKEKEGVFAPPDEKTKLRNQPEPPR